MSFQNIDKENNIFEKNNQKELVYALVGNPNSGKTTLFNHLTGLNQKVANYPGITVEKKEGCCFSQYGERIHLIDLPGAYSLCAHSPDEEVLQQVLLGKMENVSKPDRIICVLDASNLERTLYLGLQILELGYPTIFVLNKIDVVDRRGLSVNIKGLSEALGIPVIPIQANRKESLIPLKIAISQKHIPKVQAFNIDLPGKIKESLVRILHALPQNWTLGEALLLLTSTNNNKQIEALKAKALVSEWQTLLDQELPGWQSQIIQLRYQIVESLYKKYVTQISEKTKSYSARFDQIFLHPLWGWITLFLILGGLFFSIFTLSEYPMQLIESGFGKISNYFETLLPAGPIRGLIIDGAIKGVGSILIFLPQIVMLFFFIGILESTGYLSRAAFLLDRIMGKIGLPGKSFVPLLSSFACAIPGIMATRTISSKEERFTTIMIAPWMSCSARLPIYLMMISLLVPESGYSAWIKTSFLLGIYLLGILCALTLGWCFRKTIFKGKNSTSLMELPHYHPPAWKNIFVEVSQRAMIFIKRAGKMILAFSIIFWFLMNYPQTLSLESPSIEESYMGHIGKTIEPIISPLGYDWKIGIALLTSFAARELFISTIAIVNNGSAIQFTTLTCLSLIIFYIFAMQCISTLAVVKRETNSWKWPILQFVFMTAFAYLSSFIIYQIGLALGYN